MYILLKFDFLLFLELTFLNGTTVKCCPNFDLWFLPKISEEIEEACLVSLTQFTKAPPHSTSVAEHHKGLGTGAWQKTLIGELRSVQQLCKWAPPCSRCLFFSDRCQIALFFNSSLSDMKELGHLLSDSKVQISWGLQRYQWNHDPSRRSPRVTPWEFMHIHTNHGFLAMTILAALYLSLYVYI